MNGKRAEEFERGKDMFNFRVFETAEGNQVIDGTLTTSYETLTPLQMLDYIEIDTMLSMMERKKRVKKQRKRTKKLLYRIATICFTDER